jgi:HD superfamily phosphohydrolase YqeK
MERKAVCFLTKVILKEPVLLHAPVGDLFPQKYWGIADEDVLTAVRGQTLGSMV